MTHADVVRCTVPRAAVVAARSCWKSACRRYGYPSRRASIPMTAPDVAITATRLQTVLRSNCRIGIVSKMNGVGPWRGHRHQMRGRRRRITERDRERQRETERDGEKEGPEARRATLRKASRECRRMREQREKAQNARARARERERERERERTKREREWATPRHFASLPLGAPPGHPNP